MPVPNAGSSYFQLSALYDDFREFSERMDRRHELTMDRMRTIQSTLDAIKRRA